jgi:hypothetical protein
MAYKDFYHLMLEYFSQPVELFTGSRNVPFTFILKNKSCLFEMGKIIPAVSIPKKLQHLLSGLKKVKVCWLKTTRM